MNIPGMMAEQADAIRARLASLASEVEAGAQVALFKPALCQLAKRAEQLAADLRGLGCKERGPARSV